MATRNFYNKNAKHIYALIPDKFTDKFALNFVVDNIEFELDKLKKLLNAHEGMEIREYNRNYPEKIIGSFGVEKYICDIELYININVIMRAGYYEGANLDYDYRFCVNSWDYDNIPDACDEFIHQYFKVYNNAGMAKIQAKNAEKWFESTISTAIDAVKDILKKECSHVLEVAAVFSNGEALYSVVK